MSNRRHTPPNTPAAPEETAVEPVPIVAPETEVFADLTVDAPAQGVDPSPEVEPGPIPEVPVEVPDAVVASHPSTGTTTVYDLTVNVTRPDVSVTFRCERWAGVRLHGTQIKFEDGTYTTSDEGEIGRLDAWEHAERVS